jgi:hypothetical protein
VQGPSTHGSTEQETAFTTPDSRFKAQQFIVLLDPLQGFVLPPAPRDSFRHSQKRSSSNGGNEGAACIQTSNPVAASRANGAPFNASVFCADTICLRGYVVSIFTCLVPHCMHQQQQHHEWFLKNMGTGYLADAVLASEIVSCNETCVLSVILIVVMLNAFLGLQQRRLLRRFQCPSTVFTVFKVE